MSEFQEKQQSRDKAVIERSAASTRVDFSQINLSQRNFNQRNFNRGSSHLYACSDNRAEAVTQRKLQAMANNSAQVQQLKQNGLSTDNKIESSDSDLHEIQNEPVQRVDYSDASLNAKRRKTRIGLELAFNSDFTRRHFSNDGPELTADFDVNGVITEATRIADLWQVAAVAHAATLPAGAALNVTNEAHPQGAEHIFGKAFASVAAGAYGRKKFSYTGLTVKDALYDKPADMTDSDHEEWMDGHETPELAPYENRQGVWWWGITGDPAVFELQTHPTSWQILNQTDVADIIDGAIFAPAAALGLSADKGLGGGQINVDFTTGFAADYNNVLKALNNAEGKKSDMEDSGLNESDDLNAPYIYKSSRVDFEEADSAVSEDDMKTQWLILYNKYNNKLADAEDWGEFVEDFLVLLRHYPSARQRYKNYLEQVTAFFGEDDHQDDIFHYQALNVGHVSNPDDTAKRVEYRDFKAQASRTEISDAIDLALSIIPE